MSQTILVVDDKELVRDSVATMLARTGWNVKSAPDGMTALRLVSEDRPDVVLTDLSMPEMDGLTLLERLRRIDEHMPVVLMTAFATVQTAVEAMKKGAFDYLTKPFDGDELVLTIRRAVKHARLARENEVLKTQLSRMTSDREAPRLVGETPQMKLLKSHIEQIARSHGTVLIMGESGVGKEVVAQVTHAMSPRAKAPFLAINCAALSTSLLESELFGHERGAFTGAERLRKGRFELAHGGTLLLDEISEIPPGIQAKLLRILQERAFERVGSSVTQTTDVRVLATTNRDLRRAVAEGRFRQDLFYRLNVLPITVPALRDRAEDVPLLCEHLLQIVGRREGRPPKAFDEAALDLLMAYPWPGNVRELYNVCERACIFTGDDVIIRADIIRPWLVAHPPMGHPTSLMRSHAAEPSRQTVSNNGTPATLGVDAAESDLEERPDLEVEVTSAFRSHVMPSPNGWNTHETPQAGRAERSGFNGAHAASTTACADDGLNAAGEDDGSPATIEVRVRRLDAGAAPSGPPAHPDDVAADHVDSGVPDEALAIVRPGLTLEEIERQVIVQTLQRNNGHRLNTARELKIGVRTLGLKLRKWKDEQLVAADL